MNKVKVFIVKRGFPDPHEKLEYQINNQTKKDNNLSFYFLMAPQLVLEPRTP